jgi:hypothetical protein
MGRAFLINVSVFTSTASARRSSNSKAEQHFLNSVVVHFNMGWLLARSGSLLGMEGLRRDVRSFFRRPLPEAVWNETKKARDPEFVRFIESCLRSPKTK